jgi:hypothetical protein
MWSWRPVFALGVSLALHVATGSVVVMSAVWEGWRLSKNLDLELVSTKIEEVEALPLGPPPPPRSAADPAARRRARARAKAQAADEGVKVAVADGGADAGAGANALLPADGGTGDAGADASASGGDAGGVRPRDLREYGPEGSRLTALLRIDRLRTSPQAPATIAMVDQLLRHLPDRRRLIEGSGLDLYRDFDALLVATPNPLDDSVTFLAVRHKLSDDDLMAALARGGEAAGRPIDWRNDSGRPVGVRRGRRVPGTDAGLVAERDDRILVLPRPGLAIIAPPAYAALLLPGTRPPRDAGSVAMTPEQRWRELVARIDAEDSALPDDAVLMMTASNLLAGGGPRRRPGQQPSPELSAPGGLTFPPYATIVVGTAPRPFLEATAEFNHPDEARSWQDRWPGLKTTLLGSPLLLLSGFSPIVARAEVRREDSAFILRTTASQEEMRRVLATISNLMGGRGR